MKITEERSGAGVPAFSAQGELRLLSTSRAWLAAAQHLGSAEPTGSPKLWGRHGCMGAVGQTCRNDTKEAEEDLVLQQRGEQVEGFQNTANRSWEQEKLFPEKENKPLPWLRGQTYTMANN